MSDGRKKRATENEVEIKMTPMIDVTFQLLIFFVVTLQIRKLERELDSYLPTDRGPHIGPVIDSTTVDVALREIDGRVRVLLSGRLVAATDLESACTVVEERLAAFRARFPEAAVRLDVGAGVLHRDAVRALDTLHRAGVAVVRLTGVFAASGPGFAELLHSNRTTGR